MRRTRHLGMLSLFVVVALTVMLVVAVASALAMPPEPVGNDSPTGYFLCPDTGQGVANNLDKKTAGGQLPSGGYTFYPGNNQAGLHVNLNGTNGLGGPSLTNSPGHGNRDWSPIWNISGVLK